MMTVAFVVLGVGPFSFAPAQAQLRYDVEKIETGERILLISGEFTHEDDLDEFVGIVRRHDPLLVGFHSPGGNAVKAMELGRLIRNYRLNTVQLRDLECSSACALAFMGGVGRFAEPGAIGVHKSSFPASHPMDADLAVSAVQHITAEIMIYMNEMGVDPALLQLALKYESDDIRYLSRSEMQEYGVITAGATGTRTLTQRQPAPEATAPGIAALPSSTTNSTTSAVPEARTGRVRHPHGSVALKTGPDASADDISLIQNGARVTISATNDRWYRVKLLEQSLEGYMHHTWVAVDQFVGAPFEHRYIQIKSFEALQNAQAYVGSSKIPVSVYRATNGWFAVTLHETYDEHTAAGLISVLKTQGTIPQDSFMTYGNTYARKMCCD